MIRRGVAWRPRLEKGRRLFCVANRVMSAVLIRGGILGKAKAGIKPRPSRKHTR